MIWPRWSFRRLLLDRRGRRDRRRKNIPVRDDRRHWMRRRADRLGE